MVGYVAVDLYWGRCGREYDNRSLLGKGVVEYGAVDLYRARCGRVWRCRSLLGKVW